MVDKRFETSEFEDTITVTDNKEELRNGFDSEIVLAPAEDAQLIVDELNIQCQIVEMLVKELETYEDMQDIEYWIKEVREDYYD